MSVRNDKRAFYGNPSRRYIEAESFQTEEEEIEAPQSGDEELDDYSTEAEATIPDDMMQIHDELAFISKKLHVENDSLRAREDALLRREEAVKELEDAVRKSHKLLEKFAEEEVNRRWTKMRAEYESENLERQEVIREKSKEAKRLRASFEMVQETNRALKKQIEELEEKNRKLETQLVSTQKRLTNLQRKNELALRQRQRQTTATAMDEIRSPHQKRREKACDIEQESARQAVSIPKQKMSHPALPSGVYETLAILLDWLSSLYLSQKSVPSVLPITQEKCCKVLPHLAELLPSLSAHGTKLQYPCLEFIFWSLVSLESGRKHKITLSSTLRRIGEELYHPSKQPALVDALGDESDSRHQLPVSFFHSRSLHIRMLSTLIVLKTLTQVDHLAHGFDSLRADLNEDAAKDIFLQHQGSAVILPYMKMSARGLLSSAIDVFLQLSMESVFLNQFLKSCSTDDFFRSSSALLKDPKFDSKLQEKLCIVLQRLSKIKSNHRLFEAFQLGPLFHDMLCTSNPDQAFLTLNIRSILSNLNLLKSSST